MQLPPSLQRALPLVFFVCSLAALPISATIGAPADGENPAAAKNQNDAATDHRFTVHKGLVYSRPDSRADEPLKLDLFLPSDSARPLPCVVVIQGGGFRSQDGQRFRPFAVYLAKRGFAAALIAYRGIPGHPYRDTLADVKAAVRFIRSVSGQYNLDPDRIGAVGRSAGGTLAALLAVTGDEKDLEGDGGHAEYSSRIQAAVAYAGVFDFVARFTDPRQIDLQPRLETKKQTNGQWIGAPFSPENEHWLRASAVNHVDKNDPPILLVHCKDDATVPWPQSRDMHAKLTQAGVAAEVMYYETGGHGFQNLKKESQAAMVLFFRKNL